MENVINNLKEYKEYLNVLEKLQIEIENRRNVEIGNRGAGTYDKKTLIHGWKPVADMYIVDGFSNGNGNPSGKEEEKAVLEGLSLVPPMELVSTGSAFLDVWYEKERNLRCALAQIRAQKLKKDSVPLPP